MTTESHPTENSQSSATHSVATESHPTENGQSSATHSVTKESHPTENSQSSATHSVTKLDEFPLPRIDDNLDLLSGARYFTTLDLASGYWQVYTHGEDITRKDGIRYSFTKMPFGLVNAPVTFQRLMEIISQVWPAMVVTSTWMMYYSLGANEGSEMVRDWNLRVAPEPTFSMVGVRLELPPQKAGSRRASQFRAEAMSLLVDKTYSPVEAWSQPGDGGQNDSDDEVAPDEPIPPALEGEELLFFKRDHQRLHTLFHQAREASFSIKSFCEILVSPTHQVLITNPKGRFQPGSMALEWVVGEDVQPAGEWPNKNPRRGLGEGSERMKEWQMLSSCRER